MTSLDFLLGKWRGEGIGGYPTIGDFRYGQELEISVVPGKPFLAHRSRTWHLDDERPLASEVGWWRPQQDGDVELVLAHPTGIVEIYLGRVDGSRVELATDVIARTPSAKEVGAEHRLYGIVPPLEVARFAHDSAGTPGMGAGDLAYAIDMAAVGQPLQPHLSARLQRVG